MQKPHSRIAIVSMAIIASAAATLLHEGLGHGVIAWLRGDIPTELTSNHLSALRPDRLVDAGGTIVNLVCGFVSLQISNSLKERANTRYFFWILGALNLLPGAGYFLYSGILGVGDWQAFIEGMPHQVPLRIAMSLFGAALYVFCVQRLARSVTVFCGKRSDYNTVGRLPYYAAGIFSCLAGALDPLGLQLFFLSTVAAAFGGSSGLMWADSFFPREFSKTRLLISQRPAWLIAAVVIGVAYIIFLGRGIPLPH